MRTFIFAFVAGLLPALADCDQLPGYKPTLSRPLATGDTWTHPDGGLDVTFDRVVRDNRRREGRLPDGKPRDRGAAVIRVTLQAGDQAAKGFLISTRPGSDPAVVPAQAAREGIISIPKTYVVTVGRLLPASSRNGQTRSQKAYRLRLAVTVAL